MHFLPRFLLALFFSAVSVPFAQAQQLQCNPCSHGYGRVQIGTSKQYVFQLSNTGTRTLHILSKSKAGQAFTFTNFPLPISLLPGTSTDMRVTFKPTVVGKVTGSLTLVSDALNPKLVMDVWGTGEATNAVTLGVSPSSLNFGDVTVGSKASLPLTLSAVNGSVTISSINVSSSEFSIPGLVLPLTLASGQNKAVTVVFQPNASGTATATLTVVSTATNSPTNVPLQGVGVAAGSHSTDLSWNASQDTVIGYNVYRGTRHGGPYSEINPVLESSTNYTDGAVNAGATYFYVVTAVNANNQESAYSNEVQVVIPSP